MYRRCTLYGVTKLVTEVTKLVPHEESLTLLCQKHYGVHALLLHSCFRSLTSTRVEDNHRLAFFCAENTMEMGTDVRHEAFSRPFGT